MASDSTPDPSGGSPQVGAGSEISTGMSWLGSRSSTLTHIGVSFDGEDIVDQLGIRPETPYVKVGVVVGLGSG